MTPDYLCVCDSCKDGYFLLHVSTFVPLLAKVLIAPWGLKVSWLLYLFFTHIVGAQGV